MRRDCRDSEVPDVEENVLQQVVEYINRSEIDPQVPQAKTMKHLGRTTSRPSDEMI